MNGSNEVNKVDEDADFAVGYNDNDDENNGYAGKPFEVDFENNYGDSNDNDNDKDKEPDNYADTTTASSEYPTWFSDEHGNLKYVNLVVRYPCCIFCTQLFAIFAITVLLMVVVAADGQPFSDPETESDLRDIRSIQFDSLRLAQEQVEEDRRNALAEIIPQQSELADYTYWIWEAETPGGVFTSRQAIAHMKEAFDLFLEHQEWGDYCLLVYPKPSASSASTTQTDPYCDLPLTALTFYYAAEWDTQLVDSVLVQLKTEGNIELFNNLVLCYTQGIFCDSVGNDATDENIAWALQLNTDLQNITQHWDMSGQLVPDIDQATELAAYLKLVDVYKGLVDFGYDKGFSTENLVSRYSRGIVLWGGPLQQAANLTAEEREDLDEDDAEDRREYVVDNFLDEMDEIATDSRNKEINSYYFMEAIIFDVILEIIARDGMLAIFSLVFVFMWLRINTGSWFLSGVGILEIFMSIPVAWFIYSVIFQIKYFAFLNSLSIFIVAAIGADDIFIFMDAYKQSKYRHLDKLESLETRMTWVYRRTGQAMAITSATTCAAFLCTLITPLVSIQSFGIFAAATIFIDYVLVMTLFCTAVVIYHNRFEGRSCCGCCCTDCRLTQPTPTEVAKEALESGDQGAEHVDRVGNFFRTKVAGFIQVPLHRIVIFFVFFSWMAVALWQTTQIEATKEAEQFLDEDHPLQKSISILNNEFPVADDDLALRVYYAWGLGEVDRDGVRLLYDPENFGEPVFLESFDFNEKCQEVMVESCEKLRTQSAYRGLIKQKGGVGQVFCFIEELASFNVLGNIDDCDYVRRGGFKNETWTIPPDELASLMGDFLLQRSCGDPDETISSFYKNDLGWDGFTLRYASLSVESENLQPFSQEAESVTRAEYDQFVAVARELNEMVTQECGGGEVIMTDLDGIFVFMNNQAIYVRTAVQSSLLGVIIAFVVLLLTTRVLHIAFFASLSIVSVLVSVTGVMVLLGWYLGSIESILIGIIAGFSVDYVVHLAHAYESADGDTSERITAAFGDMGISVLNGMVTSVAAAVPLFFCQLQFFAKFGIFLCTTIAFSWIFANFAFMSALATFKIPIKKEGWRL